MTYDLVVGYAICDRATRLQLTSKMYKQSLSRSFPFVMQLVWQIVQGQLTLVYKVHTVLAHSKIHREGIT